MTNKYKLFCVDVFEVCTLLLFMFFISVVIQWNILLVILMLFAVADTITCFWLKVVIMDKVHHKFHPKQKKTIN